MVNWTTVHLLLVMSIILGLDTAQTNHTAAFVQAFIDEDPDWDKMTPEEQEQSGFQSVLRCLGDSDSQEKCWTETKSLKLLSTPQDKSGSRQI